MIVIYIVDDPDQNRRHDCDHNIYARLYTGLCILQFANHDKNRSPNGCKRRGIASQSVAMQCDHKRAPAGGGGAPGACPSAPSASPSGGLGCICTCTSWSEPNFATDGHDAEESQPVLGAVALIDLIESPCVPVTRHGALIRSDVGPAPAPVGSRPGAAGPPVIVRPPRRQAIDHHPPHGR
jgi:hypothetical protein